MTTYITFDDIKERLAAITNEKLRLEEEEKALEIVLNTFFKDSAEKQNKQKHPSSPLESALLVNKVRGLFNELKNKEFTATDIFEMLREKGSAPGDKNKVSMVLSKLLMQKEITAVKKGVGRSQSIYKVSEKYDLLS